MNEEKQDIYLPEPEGVRCAQIDFMWPRPAQAIDMSVDDLVAAIEHAKAMHKGIELIDPIYGQKMWFSPEVLYHIAYIGTVWVPHDQLKAQAIRASFERVQARKNHR